jgi:cytochrome P450
MMALTLEIACKTLFGVNIHNGDENIGAMIQNWIKSNMNPLIMAKVDLPGTPYRRFTRLSTELDNALRLILDRKRASGVDEGDVLSMLIESRDENGEQMTEDELVGQASILFFAGHETTANTLTWTIFLLATHPKIYAQVLAELDEKLGGAVPTLDQLNNLPYLDRVLKESMRILPSVPFLLRVAMEDTELGGYKIQRGSEVIYSPYITHHSADLYPDPERFNPDRWLTIDPSPYAYIPFGAGLRMCIGAPFALMEAKLVLAMMLQRFRLTLADTTVDRDVTVTMAPKGGLNVALHTPDKSAIAKPPTMQGDILELVMLPK